MIPAVPFYADDSSLKRPSCFWQPVKEAAAEMRRLILKCRMKKDKPFQGRSASNRCFFIQHSSFILQFAPRYLGCYERMIFLNGLLAAADINQSGLEK
jgi:hypothetical protein